MAHDHHHHHTVPAQSLNGIFIFSIVLNVLFVLIEAVVGFWQDSLSLLSDAGHNLSDVFSLLLVFSFRIAGKHSRKRFYAIAGKHIRERFLCHGRDKITINGYCVCSVKVLPLHSILKYK